MVTKRSPCYRACVRMTTWDRDAFQRALLEIGSRAHLSQAQFAELAGRSRSQFNRWTRAENQPTYEAVTRLANAITTQYPHLADLARQLVTAAGYGQGSDAEGPPGREEGAAEAKAAAPNSPASEVTRTVEEIQAEINEILARMSPEERAQWERDMAAEDARLELIRQQRRLQWARLMRGESPELD